MELARRTDGEEVSLRQLAAHLIVLAGLSLVLLPLHSVRMYNGLDGEMMRVLSHFFWTSTEFGFGLPMNVLEGLGDSFYPIQTSLIPTYLLQYLIIGPDIIPVLSYTLFAFGLFVAVYLWSRLLGMEARVGFFAAWLLVLMALPYMPWPPLNATLQIIPQNTDLLLGSAVFLTGLEAIGRVTGIRRAVAGLIVALVPSYLVITHPLFVLFIVPTTALYAAFIAIVPANNRQRCERVLALALSLLVLLLSGALLYYYGNVSYAAVRHFSDEFVRTHATVFSASILFQGAAFPGGPLLVPLAAVGALIAAIGETRYARAFALVSLGMMALHIAFGLLPIWVAKSYRGPEGWYFETALWPVYAVYAAYAVFAIVGFAWARVTRLRESAVLAGATDSLHGLAAKMPVPFNRVAPAEDEKGRAVGGSGERINGIRRQWRQTTAGHVLQSNIAFAVPLAVIAANLYWGTGDVGPRHTYPPSSTPIVDVLRAEAAVTPGDAFSGYTATINGVAGAPAGVSWFDQHALDQIMLVPATGNDHRFVGLWYFAIPTLNQYSQYITAPLYLLASRLLARPGDGQVRNILLLTRPNLPILRMLGVRFVISDDLLENGTRLRAELELPNVPTQRLYELAGANLATYSPTEIRRLDNAAALLAAMAQQPDFTRTVFLSEPVAGPLVPATEPRMTVERGGVRISALSKGTSIILVPVQFSHCLAATHHGSPPTRFSMHRANLVATAIVFSGQLDVSLRLENAPLQHSFCRYRDVEDIKALRIRDAPPPGARLGGRCTGPTADPIARCAVSARFVPPQGH